MEVNLKLDKNNRIIGTNSLGLETYFDSHVQSGGDDSAATPMEVCLEAMGACGYLDVISIIRKKRKTVTDLKINLKAERATQHPMVITSVHMIIELISPDAEMSELERAVQLSQETYCGVSAMFKRSGCTVTYECHLTRP